MTARLAPAGLGSILLAWSTATSLAGEIAPLASSATELKKLTLEELADLQVTSVSRTAEPASSAPSAIYVITQEDIERSGATRLPEALRLAPNLQVAQVDSRQWAISSRGFNNTLANKLLVMVDGRTVYTPLFAGVFWDVQDMMMDDIDRIEVISGPGATLWGANAVNGVINVITKSAKDTQGGLLLGGGGTELRDFAGVRYGGRLGEHLFYRVYGKYFDRDSTVFANGRDATNAWHIGQGGFRLDWEPTGANMVTFQGDLYSGSIHQAFSDDTTVSGGNLLGRWSHSFSEDSDLRIQMYYDRTHRRIPNTFGEDLGTYDLDAQHRFSLGRQEITWGLGYRLVDDDAENSAVLAFLPAKVMRQVFSSFVQDKIKLIEDRLQLTLGSKFEHNDYTGFEVQPSGRLAWTITRRQTVWAAISRAVRTPSRVDRDFYAPGAPPFSLIEGGPGFASEELLAYEAGYRVQPHGQLLLSTTLFYHDYENLRSTEPVNSPSPFPLIIANGLHGETYGAEFAADCTINDWWRLRGGYTLLQVHIRPDPGSLDTTRGSGESQDANHQFLLRSLMNLPGHLQLDEGFRYVSHIANQHVPSYAELDLRFAWEPIANLEFSVVGQNLLHGQHAEFGTPATRNEIERSVLGKVTWRF